MTSEAKLEPLRMAIHGIKAPFFCAGKHVTKEPIALRLKDGTRFVIERAADDRKQVADLRPLIDRCSPATFGDKRQNRFDRNIRDALQLMAAGGEFQVENFPLESTGILEAIRREMLPADSPAVTAELYSLNTTKPAGISRLTKTRREARRCSVLWSSVCRPTFGAGN